MFPKAGVIILTKQPSLAYIQQMQFFYTGSILITNTTMQQAYLHRLNTWSRKNCRVCDATSAFRPIGSSWVCWVRAPTIMPSTASFGLTLCRLRWGMLTRPHEHWQVSSVLQTYNIFILFRAALWGKRRCNAWMVLWWGTFIMPSETNAYKWHKKKREPSACHYVIGVRWDYFSTTRLLLGTGEYVVVQGVGGCAPMFFLIRKLPWVLVDISSVQYTATDRNDNPVL